MRISSRSGSSSLVVPIDLLSRVIWSVTSSMMSASYSTRVSRSDTSTCCPVGKLLGLAYIFFTVSLNDFRSSLRTDTRMLFFRMNDTGSSV